jgi:predicted NUDIX family NTP pyrophosphohydrolase
MADPKKTQKVSAGLLLFRLRGAELQLLLVHPGGPFFRKKDEGHWSIPKGEVEQGDALLETALRELEEETGLTAGSAELVPLGQIRQKGGKIVHAWAVERDVEEGFKVRSNTFELEWPPGSGRRQEFPEIDEGLFFDVETARRKIKPAQEPFIDRLLELRAAGSAVRPKPSR